MVSAAHGHSARRAAAADSADTMTAAHSVPRAHTLLLHVSLLLAVYGGAGLTLSARLTWDPSLYVAVRELLPAEYRVLCGALPVLAAALLALGHAALCAASAALSPRARRRFLLMHAGGAASVLVAEVGVLWWLGVRLAAFTRTAPADQLRDVVQLTEHLRPLMEYLQRWHPLSERVQSILDEAMADLPRNGYVAAAAGALLLVLQAAGIALALGAAAGAVADRDTRSTLPTMLSPRPAEGKQAEAEASPLRAAYRGGRLVPR